MKNATALFVFLFALASGFCVSDRSASTTDQGDPSQAPKEHMPRFYFKEAQNSAFGEVVLGMARDRVRELCGGSPYMEFETIRDGYFAFAVDY
jgi:hypothetical protein